MIAKKDYRADWAKIDYDAYVGNGVVHWWIYETTSLNE